MIADVIPQPLIVGREEIGKMEENEEYDLFHDKEGE